MTNYKLIASDLDGTLLKNDMTVSAENEAAIKKFTDMGIIFAATSGRTFYEIPECVRSNPNIRYITYSNGTVIYDKLLKKEILSNKISKEASGKVFDVLRDYDVLVSIHFDGRAYYDKNKTSQSYFTAYQVNNYYRDILLDATLIENIENCGRAASGIEAFVLFFRNDSEIDECKKRLEELDGITVTSSVEHNLELCSEKAGKGAALSALIDAVGVDGADVIAIGDNMNDTSMFSVAGLALCAGNGSNDAKIFADATICSNEEHVADYVLRHYIK